MAEELVEVVSVRMSKDDKALLVKVVGQMPAATRGTVARMALRMGLEALDKKHGKRSL